MKPHPFVLWLTFALALLLAHMASATHVTKAQLALQVAVVAAHEGALDNTDEVLLVWQVVETNGGATTADRSAFLHRHSGRVLGDKPCLGQNCSWAQQLLQRPTEDPTGFAPDWWRVARRDRWLAAWKLARSVVVAGAAYDKPCPDDVRTWGGQMDRAGAIKRGLVELPSKGVLNICFGLAPKTISAKVASGR